MPRKFVPKVHYPGCEKMWVLFLSWTLIALAFTQWITHAFHLLDKILQSDIFLFCFEGIYRLNDSPPNSAKLNRFQ